VKEPYFSRKDTKCCGRGGSLGSTNPDIAEKIAQKRIDELRKEAECIVTACPTCTLAFNGCEVYDISEIVIKSLEKKNE
jgi:Fe-S oxidoreductase